MLISDVVVAALIAAASVLCIRVGVAEWRGTGTPRPKRIVLSLVDPGTRAGMELGGLVFGVGFACLALLVVGGGTALQFHHPSREARLIVGTLLAVAAVGMIASMAVGLSIAGFNRPKMLVPPQHRAAPGTLMRRPAGPVLAEPGPSRTGEW